VRHRLAHFYLQHLKHVRQSSDIGRLADREAR
jgi:hypothetical protein